MHGCRITRSQAAGVAIAGAICLLAATRQASAHVKWFCGLIDLQQPPLAIDRVVSRSFLQVGAGFLLLLLLGTFADGAIRRRGLRLGSLLPRMQPVAIRLGVGLYCLSLGDETAVAPWGVGRTILTPELFSSARLLLLGQLGVAALTLSRRTCPAAGIGMLVLYGYGVVAYGVFHMTDYVYFITLASALMLRTGDRWAERAVPLLCAGLSFSLMWTAIEKFLYPQWTILVLSGHPLIASGLPFPSVTLIAGFVEFTLAFYLSVGRGLLRLGAAAFAAVFLSAMPAFGMLDVVGHLPILAMLAVIFLHGPTAWQRRLWPRRQGIVVEGACIGGLYLATLVVMFGLYEGIQRTTSWPLLSGTQTFGS